MILQRFIKEVEAGQARAAAAGPGAMRDRGKRRAKSVVHTTRRFRPIYPRIQRLSITVGKSSGASESVAPAYSSLYRDSSNVTAIVLR